jgi:hypothetical protein
MKGLTLPSIVLMAVCAMLVTPAIAQHEHPAGDSGKLGKVNFPVSCDPAVQPQFSSAVPMLHSFWYEKAGDTFVSVAAAMLMEIDPSSRTPVRSCPRNEVESR